MWWCSSNDKPVQLVTTEAKEAPAAARGKSKKRVLMLISDTGGGHRASAQALESMLEAIRPGETEVSIVDVYTDYCPWPFNKFVSGYQVMATHDWMWKYSWYGSAMAPIRVTMTAITTLRCKGAFERCINDHEPDLVVSLHPLTQSIPLGVLEKQGGGERRVPFATVVTDLGSAHPWWFHKGVDACFVPSNVVRKVAERLKLQEGQIKQYGLPVRPSFWEASRPREQLFNELGLEKERKTVLVVGGGDGVGSLGRIVEATANELSRECPGDVQVVAVCGKNAKLRSELEAKNWGNVNVQVCGFVKQMSDYMECADVMITKAGPGTIAEATIRGLPTMLSSFLPGQEAGNVPFVTGNGFGDYSKKPKKIAKTVRTWIQHPEQLDAMAEAARACATPSATHEIADDLFDLLDHKAA